MRRAGLFWLGRALMLLGVVAAGYGLLYALRSEAQTPDENPLGVELAAVAVGFFVFTVGRWCAAKASEESQ